MSAPTEAHETRARHLATLAVLTGYPRLLRMPAGVVPDVARCNLRGGRFVGDAKSTESPHCTATFHRLARYARYLSYDPHEGDILALAVPAWPDVRGWAELLQQTATVSGLGTAGIHVTDIDDTTAVLHTVVHHTAERPRRPARLPVVSLVCQPGGRTT